MKATKEKSHSQSKIYSKGSRSITYKANRKVKNAKRVKSPIFKLSS